ncbi:MAG: hypothetical protein LBE79_00110, partial [Tannerella sp.]|nr:hypothetical protein [Tannerella sp.]
MKDYAEVSVQARSMLSGNAGNTDLYRALGYALVEQEKPVEAVEALDNLFKHAQSGTLRPSDYTFYARAMHGLGRD